MLQNVQTLKKNLLTNKDYHLGNKTYCTTVPQTEETERREIKRGDPMPAQPVLTVKAFWYLHC
jgi:hypothetical protein